ncbi:MAG: hypothetical protein V3T84_17230, partial [Phycisphaerales bacterium]
LTRRPPFRGKDNYETLSQIIANDPSPLRRFDQTIPKSLETIVLKCLRKNPKDRYDTAEAVAEDLRRFARGEPVEAQPLPPWAGVTRRAWKYSPRIGVIVMAATLVFLLVSLLLPTDGMVTRQVWAPALDAYAPSPDGRYLTYINWTTGNLAVHDLETGENRDVTDEGTFENEWQYSDVSIWSPDSRQIAYYWLNGEDGELRIVDLKGSKPRVLSSSNWKLGHAPWPREWSKDGKYILAIRSQKDESQERGKEGQIVLVSVADGSVRVLKSLGERRTRNMSLSPDGRYVVFDVKDGSERYDIHLLATDGSREVPLVEHPAADRAPFWTPDGKRIVFVSDRSGSKALWMLDVDDGKPKGTPTLAKGMGSHFWPMGFISDGSFYYGVGTPANDVYVATLDFEAGKVVAPPIKTSLRFEGSNYAPVWSPDGKYLAYASWRSSGTVLVIRSVESGQERDLSPKTVRVLRFKARAAPRWSPDGGSILVTGIDWKRGPSVFLVDAETGNLTSIVQDEQKKEGGIYGEPHWPVFSNDGKQIYYIRGDRSIVARNLETRRERELYRTNTYIVRLACSPDGRRLAFFEGAQIVRPTVVKTISTSGGEPSELYTLKEGKRFSPGVGISWTPDGRHVVVGGPDGPDKPDGLWSIPATGGEPRKLNLGVKVNHLALHPDGRRIAFTGPDPKGGGEIWVMENFLP